MKKLFLIFTMFISASFVVADDHEVKIESDGTVAEFNYFTVTNPVAFVNSLNMFDKSECAKKWREESNVNVSLWALRGSPSTHFILVVYDNYEQMEKGRAIFTSCPASSRMIASFSKTTETTRTYNWVTENALSGRDWQTNSVFAKFNFSVERGKEMNYALAWKDLMSSSLDLFDGSFGLNAVAFGNRYSTHMVYIGADSMADLSEGLAAVRSTDTYKEFVEDTSGIVSGVHSQMVQFVKNYDGT
tara:strand:+ start:1435 stop:2169 length:735 start_codon:yes stop_codon:yes gene_type:complete